MMNKAQFQQLLDRHVSGNQTPEQYQELMQLIKSGQYDDLLKEYIDYLLLHNTPVSIMDNKRAEELLQRILKSEEQTAKLIPVSKQPKKYQPWLAAAAILLIGVFGWTLLSKKNKTTPNREKNVAHIQRPGQLPAATNNGKKYIRLPDGSTVLLNEGSKLDYPDSFTGDTREVVLSGEAYFDIQHDTAKPFIVHTNKVSTTVLGTAFNIKAYPREKEVVVTVTRGKVKVSDDKKKLGVLLANESIVVNLDTKTYRQEKVNAEDVVLWKKQYLVFDNISMGDAALLINSRYHVNISFSKESIKGCVISATFLDNENLEQVLNVVTAVVNANYTTQPNDQIIISGSGCN